VVIIVVVFSNLVAITAILAPYLAAIYEHPEPQRPQPGPSQPGPPPPPQPPPEVERPPARPVGPSPPRSLAAVIAAEEQRERNAIPQPNYWRGVTGP
jgi:hypothetical protein